MSLAPPPPRRSRRERIKLPPPRAILAVTVPVALLVALLVWAPWQPAGRKEWRSAPPVPAQPVPPERAWLDRLATWVAFVRDAAEDPTSLTIRACANRLDALGAPPERLREVRALAQDTCGALTAAAVDRRRSQVSFDPGRAGKANDDEKEAARDVHLLLAALRVRTPPGGTVVAAYSRIASKLSGRDATVRCWNSDANWHAVETSLTRTEPRLHNLLGFAMPSESRVELSPTTCRELAGRDPGARPSLAVIDAVEVLTHESEHLVGPDGIDNEAKTDCYAAQRMATTARLLGLARWRPQAAARLYLRALQPQLPRDYRSPDCRPGGRFDLTPGDRRWP